MSTLLQPSLNLDPLTVNFDWFHVSDIATPSESDPGKQKLIMKFLSTKILNVCISCKK